MALFNKLFSSRKKSTKNQDLICNEKVFLFNKDQVRIVLFRECDLKGRKLLFDSHSVQKVALSIPTTGNEISSQNLTTLTNGTYVEISNGYGYQYIKPCSDIGHLAEMVFGAVAMSYRGTSLKIHSLKSPSRLMCSQIFPTPRYSSRGCSSAPSQSYICTSLNSSQSLEQSIRLDDSGTSSANSISDRLSVNSTGSDTLLVCRGMGSCSIPLDVPAISSIETTPNNSNLTSSVIGDSGFCGEQSYNSVSSGLHSLPSCYNIDEVGGHSFSCGSLYRRWLRSASTSFEHSVNLLTGSASADECLLKRHSRNSKLGLAVIIELPFAQEESLEHFLMEHIAHLESLVWRTRQGAEIAYIRHNNFVSLMFEVAANAIQWLVDLLTGPQLSTHMWISLALSCDKINSINSFNKNSDNICRTLSSNTLEDDHQKFTSSVSSVSLSNSFKSDFTTSCGSSDTLNTSNEFTFMNLTKFLKNEWIAFSSKNSYSCCDKNIMAEKCVTELCELLDCIDVKHTNFFVSTLLTAVLTHHLGWVTTVLPPSTNDKEQVSNLHNPCNPLWGQLTDLYGAIGGPSKMAHTIITGTNKTELISKILNSLTYFIRCSDTERKYVSRLDINEDNSKVDCIFQQKCCIPKENFKKYVDHLKEMEEATKADLFKKSYENNTSIESIEMQNLNVSKPTEVIPTKILGLSKSKTNVCLNNLDSRTEDCKRIYPRLDDFLQEPNDKENLAPCRVQNLNIEKPQEFNLSNSEINDKVRKLCCIPPNAVAYHKNLGTPKKIEIEKQTSSDDKDVIFVLGDNETLVDIKKDKTTSLNLNPPSCSETRRPTHLDLSDSKVSVSASINTNFQDSDFIQYETTNNIKPSTSWSSLAKHSSNTPETSDGTKKDFIRSQSVPPEQEKPQTSTETKSKYRYSGVKFNFQQYPQIVTNYMRSKNLELAQLPIEKTMEFNSMGEYPTFDFFMDDKQGEEVQTLQTPSNASELEFTSDLVTEKYEAQRATEKKERKITKTFIRNHLPNTIIKETSVDEHPLQCSNAMFEHDQGCPDNNNYQSKPTNKMQLIEVMLPSSQQSALPVPPINYTNSLMRGIGERYVSDMVLQGITAPKCDWETALRKDLSLAARHSLLDQPVDEAVAIVANTDTWEVQLLSSHTYVVNRGSSGVRVGMSQLVSNMLESLLFMWKLHTPPKYCIMHIEQRLQEFCTLSKALAELLIETEFCSMELLTSVLQLEVNDVPLLMAVASTHSPQVTQKYGLSFQ